MKGSSRKAFSHNVEAEMHAGKPQKQAVAIAYSEAGEHKAKGGMMKCSTCGKANCMEHGGEVKMDDGGIVPAETPPVKKPLPKPIKNNEVDNAGGWGGAMKSAASGWWDDPNKNAQPGAEDNGYAEGGKVRVESDNSATKREGKKPIMRENGKMMAEGGEVEEMDMKPMHEDMDHELNEMACEELMDGFEKKDKKQILEAIKALVLNMKE